MIQWCGMRREPERIWLVRLALGAIVAGFLPFGELVFQLRRPEKRPNVVLIMIDTLRADHVGLYGYNRPTTPYIDQFGRENVTFRRAFTAAPWTPPSVASLLTGLYASSHGMSPPQNRRDAREAMARLSDELLTIAEYLDEESYRTLALSSNPWISEDFGFEQGFHSFRTSAFSDAETVTSAAVDLLKDELGGSPYFLYLHYLDPHSPYTPPERFHAIFRDGQESTTKEWRDEIDRYDGEIRYLDREVGRLLEHLRSRSDYERTIIIIVSDHGEQFGEHGKQGHGHSLYNEETWIPLIIKPGESIAAREVREVCSTIDILPTILALTGTAPRTILPGRNLLDREALRARSGVMTELLSDELLQGFISAGGEKLIARGGIVSKETLVKISSPVEVLGVFDAFSSGVESRLTREPELLSELKKNLVIAARAAYESRPLLGIPKNPLREDAIENLATLGYLK